MAPDFLGTLPQWLTAAFSGGALGLAGLLVKWQLGKGKLAIDAQQVQVNARQVALADDADIRDHYAEELSRVVKRQHECEEREQALRDRVTTLEDKILGLIRIIAQASADKVLFLGDEVPDDIRDMAERVRRIGEP